MTHEVIVEIKKEKGVYSAYIPDAPVPIITSCNLENCMKQLPDFLVGWYTKLDDYCSAKRIDDIELPLNKIRYKLVKPEAPKRVQVLVKLDLIVDEDYDISKLVLDGCREFESYLYEPVEIKSIKEII